jgi:predicted dehydrogenase
MNKRFINFGVIGCGLMGREFASAAGRWCHLLNLDFAPRIVAACDANPKATEWFEQNCSVPFVTTDYRQLLERRDVEAVYCAVPHNLHAQLYCDIIRAGKHLLGEKPFGIDLRANDAINDAIRQNPRVFVRCSSEIPFYPGAYRISQWLRDGKFGRIIEVEAGFWHSSDLDPRKPINWKRRVATCGEYGVLGDLGMHVVHMPFRFGWRPKNVRALLSKIVKERPDPAHAGATVPCDTWDNATLACEVEVAADVRRQESAAPNNPPPHVGGYTFPLLLSTKRIAPGHANTWFIRIHGTSLSAEYTTKNPKQLAFMPYATGGEQAWQMLDVPHQSAYAGITGGIFEFGFSDAILQMWAAFCDELVNGAKMKQPFHCATPEEAAASHRLFTAALESQKTRSTVELKW